MRGAGRIFDHILTVLFAFSGVLLAFATCSVALGILSRYFFARPIAWVTEISEYILLFITFLVAAWVLKHDEHVKMDIILNLFPPSTQSVINFITSIISAFICLVITLFGARVTWILYKSKAFTYTILELPKFIFTSVILIGGFLLFIQFLRRACGYLAISNGSEKLE